jgi:carbon-monoxide dehydrogenase small subunit
MSAEVTLTVNSTGHRLAVAPTETLVSVLRDRLGLTGTQKDCAMGICGACTVLLDDQPVSACLLLAVQAEGAAITTVEALEGNGELSPLQHAFLTHGAVQCGFCTPGFLMTATALLADNPNPSRAEIVDAIKGNLCRCTGYQKIVDAIESVAEAADASS